MTILDTLNGYWPLYYEYSNYAFFVNVILLAKLIKNYTY
jgi:hypothetical protein